MKTVKTCQHCGKEFTPGEFHPNQRYCCKVCCDAAYYLKRREYGRQYYAKHREECLAYGRQYYAKHREECLAYGRQYYAKHREECLTYCQQYYAKHREECLTYCQQYYAKNSKKCLTYGQQYYAKHREECNAKSRQYYAANRDGINAWARKRRQLTRMEKNRSVQFAAKNSRSSNQLNATVRANVGTKPKSGKVLTAITESARNGKCKRRRRHEMCTLRQGI